MATNNGILIPAAQKLYSALSKLEKFSKHNDFFDNVSYLDAFLSEYRNVTFVIQKSLAHTDLIGIYERLRDRYLTGEIGKWFVDKRNEVIKEHPFQLIKVVEVTIYDSGNPLKWTMKQFSVEDDEDYSTIIKDIHEFLRVIHVIEIPFSIEFIYKEIGSNDNLFDKLFIGIDNMLKFFTSISEELHDESKAFSELKGKIMALNILRLNSADLFVDDFVYYQNTDKIEHGARIEFHLPDVKFPLANLPGVNSRWQQHGLNVTSDELHKIFLEVLALHISIYIEQNRHIMPTIFIVYNDLQARVNSFDSSQRSTVYRKINDVAKRIRRDRNISAVFIIHECWTYSNKSEIVLSKNYEERVATENPISTFSGHMIGDNLDCYSYYFEESKIESPEYIAAILSQTTKLLKPQIFMQPIYQAFMHNKSNQEPNQE